METEHIIDTTSLPDISEAEVDFRDTSFFLSDSVSRQLPTPTEILEKYPDPGEGVLKFEHLHLVVKVGQPQYLRLEEALAMRVMRQIFPDHDVPVPEVFGWRKTESRNFIYMSLVRGQTLRQAWPSFTESDKEAVTSQLKRIVEAMRSSINGGPVTDVLFQDDYVKGPFDSLKSFNDWTLAAATRQTPGPEGVKTLPHRDSFPDSGNIYFTHGDLTLRNIMILGSPGAYRIESIIDWEQAGWYPEYWEYCKMQYAIDYEHEWRVKGWNVKVMEPWEDAWEALGDYYSWRCP